MKNFYDKWNEQEIEKYVKEYCVLVLFEIDIINTKISMNIYGTLNDNQKSLLRSCIIGRFGNKRVEEDTTIQINEYAEEWYENYIKSPKIRLLNSRR